MECLVCQQKSDSVELRGLPWKIPKKTVEEAERSKLLPRPIPPELLEKDAIAVSALLCDQCDEKVRSGQIGRDELTLRAVIAYLHKDA